MPASCAPPAPAAFLPFSAQAFDQARLRDVPVLLFICDAPPSFADAALNMQIFERTVPVWLYPGMRPDVELLCQRAGALFSGEGALPLCALMLEDARVFLAAPLPPAGFALDPSRLYVWLSQADRRFAQNRDAFIRQAAQTVRSFRAEPLRKPYSPGDAAHDLTRALPAVHDPINGGFGKLKQPLCPALRFLSRAALRDRQAHAALDRPLCYNGDLFCEEDCRELMRQFPNTRALMLGRGLIANPALAQSLGGGEALCKASLRTFHDRLLEAYQAKYPAHVTLGRMREIAKHFVCCFDAPEKPRKAIRKATRIEAYLDAIDRLFAEHELNETPRFIAE